LSSNRVSVAETKYLNLNIANCVYLHIKVYNSKRQRDREIERGGELCPVEFLKAFSYSNQQHKLWPKYETRTKYIPLCIHMNCTSNYV